MVNVLMLSLSENGGCGRGTSCESIPMLGADVNSAASTLVVLAVKCRELTVTETCMRHWECTTLEPSCD